MRQLYLSLYCVASIDMLPLLLSLQGICAPCSLFNDVNTLKVIYGVNQGGVLCPAIYDTDRSNILLTTACTQIPA